MKKKSDYFFMKNSELSMEFSKYVLEHPEIDEVLTEEKLIIFLPKFDHELKEFNLIMAKEIEAGGGKVLYVRMKQLTPKVSSRLVGVEIDANQTAPERVGRVFSFKIFAKIFYYRFLLAHTLLARSG